ncbi:MAG: glycoside hydrolase family 43 protein [Clostridia bacterium]|nr:glycoside hydrolase family 43 protein [Clostridia bacterium]
MFASNKRVISMLMCVVLLVVCFPVSASANGEHTPVFLFSAAAQKAEYAKGEEITVDALLKNNTFSDIENYSVTMTYSGSDTYLVAGRVEETCEVLEYNGSRSMCFTLYENETAVSIGTKLARFISFLAKIVKRFVYAVSQLTPEIEYVKARRETVFGDFPQSLNNLLKARVCEELGSCTVTYDGHEITCSFRVRYDKPAVTVLEPVEKTAEATDRYSVAATVTPSANGVEVLSFGGTIENSKARGGVVYIDGSSGRVGIGSNVGENFESLAFKLADIEAGKEYRLELNYDRGRIKLWLMTDPSDTDPAPMFDIYKEFDGAQIGRSAGVTDVTVGEVREDDYTGETYTNPVCDNAPDPFILFDDGVYYLYATNRPGDGYDTCTSEDLVHWTYGCQVARKDDLAGESDFWAPEVYKYNGKYYLLYTSQVHLGLAVADAPTGPFVKTSDSFLFDFKCLDGNLFFDDDGRIFLYFSRTYGGGQCLWGCEMNADLTPKTETLKQLSEPEGWEITINEGPEMIKHNGTYYLTYSGDGFDSINYGVGVMTCSKPLGSFEKSRLNPILKYTAFLHGPGHHCFAPSPDGSELFICYHSHYSTTQVNVRRMNIDRVKFVPTENGVDKITFLGPTMTPQPIPSK